jgi:subtilisin family serine protease
MRALRFPGRGVARTRSVVHRVARAAVGSSLVLGAISGLACSDATTPIDHAAQVRADDGPANPAALAPKAGPIDSQYIVTFTQDVQDIPGLARAMMAQANADSLHTYTSALHGFAARMAPSAAEALSHNPQVESVEQDSYVAVADTEWNAPWGLDRIDQPALPINHAYAYTANGSGVNVYIIDTGIRHTHREFAGRVVPAFTAIADSYGADGCHWHGTHVAGTVGGTTVGVAKAVTLYSVRVLDCSGVGSISDVIAGMDWVTANRVLPAVANMSVSAGYSSTLNAAVQNMINSGVTVVVAAGNASADACTYSPSSASSAVTVAASTEFDGQADFSNYGTCVDLYAPGTNVLSATNTTDTSLVTASGTSMATPHVTGAAALYLQAHPTATPADVAQALVGGATANQLGLLGAGSPNLLVYVSGSGDGSLLQPPAPTPSLPAPTPPNAAPVASFSVTCPQNKNTCSFDASSSTDDVGVTSYAWDFGVAGATTASSAPTTKYTYKSKGSYTVTLTVTDGGGLQSSTQKTVSIKSLSR